MSGLVGYPVQVKVHASSFGSATAVGGVNSLSYGPSRKQIDVSEFSSTITAEQFIMGLHSGRISLKCNYLQSDTGQALLRSSESSGADVYVVMIFNPGGSTGSKGYQVLCKCTDFSVEVGVNDAVSVTYNLVFSNASTGTDGTPAVDA